MGEQGIREKELGIRVLPLQGNGSLRMKVFYQPVAPLGSERATDYYPKARSKYGFNGSVIRLGSQSALRQP